jgi:hypothetical protein
VSEHARQNYDAKYPALAQLLVEVLASQYYPDWLERAVADHVANSDRKELEATRKDLMAASADPEIRPADLARLTNYRLESQEEVVTFLGTLRELLDKALKQ